MSARLAAPIALALAASGAHAKVVRETIDVPVDVVDFKGQRTRQSIKVTILRDDAARKSPFIVLNHGRPTTREAQARVSIEPLIPNARWFASRGFAVFLPLRVGYGESGGPDVEFSGACARRDYAPVYEAAAAQTVAVIDHARKQPWIDATNGVVAGQSFGGTTAIAVAAKALPGVRAALNFAGGGGGNPEAHPEEPCSEPALAALLSSYGATARIPTLWLYSENDRYWGMTKPRAWFDGFVARGGKGQFVQLPPWRDNGHGIFTGNPATWRPAVDPALTACCFAGR